MSPEDTEGCVKGELTLKFKLRSQRPNLEADERVELGMADGAGLRDVDRAKRVRNAGLGVI